MGLGTTSLDKPNAGVHCQVTVSDADVISCSVVPSQKGRNRLSRENSTGNNL